MSRLLHLTNPLMKGPDVRALQGLLNHKGFKCRVDSVFGHETATQCVEAKIFLHYPTWNQKPTAGDDLRRKLNNLPDGAHHAVQISPKQRFVREMRWAIQNHGIFHYSQHRPIPHPRYHVGPIYSDCSGTLTLLAAWAGCPDPNGRHFDGNGYTGTMLQHCRHITSAMAEPGDLIVYGPFPGHHVVGIIDGVVHNGRRDFELASHGREGGLAHSVLNSVEQGYQPYPESFLRFV